MGMEWPLVPLDQVLTQSNEVVQPQSDQRYLQVTVRLWGGGVLLRNEVSGSSISARKRRVIRSRQFILSRIDARNGALGLVPLSLDGAVVSNDFPSFDINRLILEPRFLDWMSKTEGFVNLCRAASEGTTNRVRLKVDRLLATSVPLPPISEQHRIVSRIEELAAPIEEAHQLRIKAREELDTLCGSAAIDAFSRLEAGLIAIGDLAEVRGGIQKSPKRVPTTSPVRYLTVAHVQRNSISLSDPRFFQMSSDELKRWALEPRDLLVVEGNGSAAQIGRTALFRGEIDPCVHQNHLIRVRARHGRIVPEYLNAYLNSPLGRAEMLKRSRTSSGLFILSVSRIKSIRVPLPSLSKQHSVVTYLNVLQDHFDGLATLQDASQAELDALLPSVLDRAFGGKL